MQQKYDALTIHQFPLAAGGVLSLQEQKQTPAAPFFEDDRPLELHEGEGLNATSMTPTRVMKYK